MINTLLACLLLSVPGRAAEVDASSAPVKAEKPAVSPEMQKAVRRLMVLTDSIKLGEQMQEALLAQFREALSEKVADKERYDDLMGAVDRGLQKHLSKEVLEDLTIDVYARHATVADLKAFIKFYETPAGRRMTKAMPLIMKESIDAGMRLGNDATMDMLRELAPKYPEFAELLPESERPAPEPEKKP